MESPKSELMHKAMHNQIVEEKDKRIRELEEIKLLAEKHMFFTTEIMNHRSKSKKCRSKKCLVCAELELQDVAIVIDLMKALSDKEVQHGNSNPHI